MDRPDAPEHAWLPRASCDTSCLRAGGSEASRRLIVALRVTLRVSLGLLLAPALLLVALPLPGRSQAKRVYCRLLLWCLGVRIAVSGGPIRNLPGVLVVSDHVSWLDIVTIAAVLPTGRWRTAPASFVGRADVAANLAVRMMACIIKVIPIERASLRQLPGVVDAVAARLRAGQTVVAFPEGTTWCGLANRAVLSGDVPGRGRRRPTRAAAAAALSPPRRQGLDRAGLHRRRHAVAARSVGCWSPAARWPGSTSSLCSCPVTIGASWPVAARPRFG